MVFFNESSDEVFNETVPFPRKNVTLSFLRPYTFYTIQVLAFTIKGNGPKSPPITVRTEEEGKEYGRRNCDLKARFPLFGASWGQMRLLDPPKIKKKKERPSPKDVLCSSYLLSSFFSLCR